MTKLGHNGLESESSGNSMIKLGHMVLERSQ